MVELILPELPMILSCGFNLGSCCFRLEEYGSLNEHAVDDPDEVAAMVAMSVLSLSLSPINVFI